MRFVLEHPWLASISISAIAFALVWTGLRDGVPTRTKIGIGVFCIAVVACLLGIFITTPTEHAKRVVFTFVEGVEENDVPKALSVLHHKVRLVDWWDEISNKGIQGIRESINKLHTERPLSFNVVLKLHPVEREDDVLVDLSLLSRVARIGTVPSRWKLLLMPDEQGIWKIYSIDAIEIMGKSYR